MPRSNPDNSPEKKVAYQEWLKTLDDDGLAEETRSKIWLSAYASNNPNSCYHWQRGYTYQEWTRRGKVEKYEQAWKAAAQ